PHQGAPLPKESHQLQILAEYLQLYSCSPFVLSNRSLKFEYERDDHDVRPLEIDPKYPAHSLAPDLQSYVQQQASIDHVLPEHPAKGTVDPASLHTRHLVHHYTALIIELFFLPVRHLQRFLLHLFVTYRFHSPRTFLLLSNHSGKHDRLINYIATLTVPDLIIHHTRDKSIQARLKKADRSYVHLSNLFPLHNGSLFASQVLLFHRKVLEYDS